jgi:hypothetical protein
MRPVQMKSIQKLFCAVQQKLLKIVPISNMAGVPLTHWPMYLSKKKSTAKTTSLP